MKMTGEMKPLSKADELLVDIVKCGMRCEDPKNPCHPILDAQGCKSMDDFHLPEPWNGDIENAKLLFLGINPRFNPNELFPKIGNTWWTTENGELVDEKVIDYFKNRFSSSNEYVKHRNGRAFRVRCEDGTYKHTRKGVWQYMHKLARIILGDDVEPGRDYALTEIVHCKTHKETDLPEACCHVCKNEWLDKVFEVSRSLSYIVTLGDSAMERVSELFSICNPERYKWYSVDKCGRKVHVLFGYHSNYLDRGELGTYESFQKVVEANRKNGIGVQELPTDMQRRTVKNISRETHPVNYRPLKLKLLTIKDIK